MTNKPMLSVDRQLLEEMLAAMKETHSLPAKYYGSTLGDRVRAILESHSEQADPSAIGTLRRDCDERIVFESSGEIHIKDGIQVYAEQPAPVADQTQCEECKGWGYHENHHEGGGTECGECGGSGKATVDQFSGDTVVCRRYQLEQHPGQNFYHYDLEPVYGSVPVTVSELITMVESAPVAVVLPDRLKTEPFTTIDRGSKNYKAGYNAAIVEVAKLNGLKT